MTPGMPDLGGGIDIKGMDAYLHYELRLGIYWQKVYSENSILV
jgi:hypothetical protein